MKRRLIDANAITPDSELIKTITNLISECKGNYTLECPASNCNECIARFFAESYSHLTPTKDDCPIGEWLVNDYGEIYCSNCGTEAPTDDYDSVRGKRRYIKSDFCPHCGSCM